MGLREQVGYVIYPALWYMTQGIFTYLEVPLSTVCRLMRAIQSLRVWL